LSFQTAGFSGINTKDAKRERKTRRKDEYKEKDFNTIPPNRITER
jgi:hypothetical protein